MDAILNGINDFLAGGLQYLLKGEITIGTGFYDSLIGTSIETLRASPESWNAGVGWNIIVVINNGFVVFAASLYIIFWLIGICSDSLDIRSNLRLEVVLKHIAKLIVGEFIITHTIDIIKVILSLVYSGTGLIMKVDSTSSSILADNSMYGLDSTLEAVSSYTNIWELILLIVFGIVFMFTMLIVGGGILYLTYVRLFKVLMIIPLSSLASSTIASSHQISSTTISYWKYAFATILEAVTIMIAIVLGTALMKSNAITFASLSVVMSWMAKCIIIGFTMLGAIKEASAITHRAFGAG